MLLTTRPLAMGTLPRGGSLYFAGATMSGAPEVVMQSEDSITVYLGGSLKPRQKPLPPYQVLVETDPSSPAVGVNLEAVHQVLTIGGDNPDSSVTIPIIAGAPNPGVVDVSLTLTPINPPPRLAVGPPLHLKILASEEYIPPSMGRIRVTREGIVVKFTKPMDPAGASNVSNYDVKVAGAGKSGGANDGWYTLANFINSMNTEAPTPPKPVRIKAARYDPATQSVMLVPLRKPNFTAAQVVVKERLPKHPSGQEGTADNGPPITDLHGGRLSPVMYL